MTWISRYEGGPYAIQEGAGLWCYWLKDLGGAEPQYELMGAV